MVQKYCPECKDWIPVACKTCPCGHKFVKTESKDMSKFEIEALNTSLNRKENGRPKRMSAMNSLYYHSSLHVSSYKLAKHAVSISTKKKKAKSAPSQSSTSPSETTTPTQSDVPVEHSNSPKRKKGRPPRVKSIIPECKPSNYIKRPEIAPNLRSKITRDYIENSTLSSNSNESESKTRSCRAVNESESYSKLYNSLTAAQKQHYAVILADINKKFYRNSRFPLHDRNNAKCS